MIIKNLFLKKFGKFENKEFEFSPKFNIFYGKNESGKSTIATSLKALFYTDLTGKGKFKKNYVPLTEDKGYFDVDYSLDNGTNLKSLVTFGKTNGKTLVKTINEDTGDSLSINGAQLGEHFFGVSEEMFDSVYYIRDLSEISGMTKNKADVHDALSKTENNIIDIVLAFEENHIVMIPSWSCFFLFVEDDSTLPLIKDLLGTEGLFLRKTTQK